MIDRTHAEALLYRVAVSAFGYYPDKPTAEIGYTIDEDIDWCLDAVPQIPAPHRTAMRDRIAEAITDPTRERESFSREVLALADR